MTTETPAPVLTRQPTAEQQLAIDKYLTGENFVIVALAGTGKTTTLKMLADQNPERRGLYVSFNKAIAMDAQAKFAGTNVDCRTAHSLAYGGFGAPRKHRMERRMNPTDTAKHLGMARIDIPGFGMVHKVAPPTAMKVVIDTVTKFCSTADDVIGPQHVTVPVRLDFKLNDAGLAKTADDDEARAAAVNVEKQATADFIETIVHWAKVYWADITEVNGALPVSHSHYLKLWALSHPVLPYDYIMYDEAQDSDPVTTGVILEQENTQVVVVGDNYQAIYAWRGAENSLSYFGGDVINLTQSFRFGDDIAEFANVFLETLDADIRIRGTETKRSSVFTEKHSHRNPDAILCRTNGGAMVEILFWLKLGFAVCIAGEKKAAELRAIAQAALDLQKNHWTTHPDFKDFRRWEDVLEFVNSEEEGSEQFNAMVNVIVRTGAEDVIAAIDSCVPADEADITISTVHVAKGLEWTHVRISGDFRPPKIDKETGETIPITAEEAMIMYVAVTRAKRHLDAKNVAWILDYEAGVEG